MWEIEVCLDVSSISRNDIRAIVTSSVAIRAIRGLTGDVKQVAVGSTWLSDFEQSELGHHSFLWFFIVLVLVVLVVGTDIFLHNLAV